jgi:CRISPR-associated protein (TIGR03984 family)
MSRFVPTPLPTIEALKPEDVSPQFESDLRGYLAQHAAQFLKPGEKGFALIHADDGVLWARIENGAFVTPPPHAWIPALRARTVQQCRVFGEGGELFIWRIDEGRWRGRFLLEEQGRDYCAIKEQQVLWGNSVDASLADDFTAIIERPGNGVRQVVPIPVVQSELDPLDKGGTGRRVLLSVIHYLGEDGDGQMLVKYSRLQTVLSGNPA